MANYIIVGLGNPGQEYESTRHNTGRICVDAFAKKNEFNDFAFDKKVKGLVADGKIGKNKVTLLEPETFMNNSGNAVKYFVKTKKDALGLVVVHDDLDLPLGRFKISFNKTSGGHRGVESIIKAVKTTEFVRVRVGISKATASGKIKKPTGEKDVLDFIIGKFTKNDFEEMKKVAKDVSDALKMIIEEGKDKAMGEFNGR